MPSWGLLRLRVAMSVCLSTRCLISEANPSRSCSIVSPCKRVLMPRWVHNARVSPAPYICRVYGGTLAQRLPPGRGPSRQTIRFCVSDPVTVSRTLGVFCSLLFAGVRLCIDMTRNYWQFPNRKRGTAATDLDYRNGPRTHVGAVSPL